MTAERSTPEQAAPPFLRLFTRYLKDRGLPLTHQRQAVAEVVFEADGHLSVDEIEAELRDRGEKIGKATIYRTMDLLVRGRLVEERDFGEGFKRYEDRLSGSPLHAHMICVECGTVTEFESQELFTVEQRLRSDVGFITVRRRLEVYGLCQTCQDAGVELTTEGLICPIEIVR